jgi:hypothetical protein
MARRIARRSTDEVSLPTDNDRRRITPSGTEIVLPEPIVEGVVVSPGITRIIKLEASTSEDQWELARLYAEELEKPGMTTRKLGNLVSKSHTHVRFMAKAWEDSGVNLVDSLPAFHEAYQLAKVPETSAIAPPGKQKSLAERLAAKAEKAAEKATAQAAEKSAKKAVQEDGHEHNLFTCWCGAPHKCPGAK